MHFMIDLETLSLDSNAKIVSIGAVAFDWRGIHDDFYVAHLDPDGQGDAVVSTSTLDWWAAQSPDVRAVLDLPPDNVPFHLGRLAGWMLEASRNQEIDGVWGNGASFDNVVLKNLYQRLGYPLPWKYSADRCYRTIKNLAVNDAEPVESEGVEHNALDDARYQARRLIAINDALDGIIL